MTAFWNGNLQRALVLWPIGSHGASTHDSHVAQRPGRLHRRRCTHTHSHRRRHRHKLEYLMSSFKSGCVATTEPGRRVDGYPRRPDYRSPHVTSRHDSRVLHGEQAELDRGHGLARKRWGQAVSLNRSMPGQMDVAHSLAAEPIAHSRPLHHSAACLCSTPRRSMVWGTGCLDR
jgi:hypothetical protein